jgi:hypothetical protein
VDTPTTSVTPQPATPYQPFQKRSEDISLGEWMITLLLTYIPIVNIVMLFVWAFGSTTNPSKANWAKASLLWLLIGIVLAIILMVVIGTAFFSAVRSIE